MEKLEVNPNENCFICSEYMGPFKNELSVCTGYSDKPIYLVFGIFTTTKKYFGKFIRLLFILETFTKQKLSDDAIFNAGICQNCFIKFNEFDEHQSIAQRIQSEILTLYESSLSMEVEMKLEIKREVDIGEYGIVEVMLEDDDENLSDGSDMLSKLKSSRNLKQRGVEKRSYRRKKNLDEGLTVVEVDGEKIYQCDVCKKLCKDRYKLKTHREIHTSVRSVCCTECGAMFKTLTCLYSHKKIHRDRVYHQW